MSNVDAVLEARGNTYGCFSQVAGLSQRLQHTISTGASYNRLTPVQKEALQTICSKISRIVNGDPDYLDSWIDIQGYAELAIKEIKGKSND